jgi:hypothetical protein
MVLLNKEDPMTKIRASGGYRELRSCEDSSVPNLRQTHCSENR